MQADYECLEKEVKQTLWAVWRYNEMDPHALHSVWVDEINALKVCEALNRHEHDEPYFQNQLPVNQLSWREFMR